ncbi:hypothetical protein H0H81_004857 [Sphagnurus paluster]|uniref:Uncharacterized protein n=1 Tax=Sphagnurus paluster TaxID=117069 RepID=A0A9P7FNQ9_9AGAR|nr:hypothetical protein H0H81_004857 [Sphagnurus paluster]
MGTKPLGDLAKVMIYVQFTQQPYDVSLGIIDITFGPLVEALKVAFLEFRPQLLFVLPSVYSSIKA